MIGNSTAETRLCPHCANSIAEDATDCRYCKTDFSSQFAPRWLKRDDPSSERRIGSDNYRRSPIPVKFIWMGAMLLVAAIAFLPAATSTAASYCYRHRPTQNSFKRKTRRFKARKRNSLKRGSN